MGLISAQFSIDTERYDEFGLILGDTISLYCDSLQDGEGVETLCEIVDMSFIQGDLIGKRLIQFRVEPITE